MKVCLTCKTEKPETEFWKRNARGYKDGLHYNCKTCAKALRAKSRYENRKRIAEQRKISFPKWQRANKVILQAHTAVHRALAKGILVKLPCWVCGNLNSEAHHPSYAPDMRLEVVWLCRDHHKEAHWCDRETIAAKVSAAHKGQKRSPEMRAKISAAVVKQWERRKASPNFKTKTWVQLCKNCGSEFEVNSHQRHQHKASCSKACASALKSIGRRNFLAGIVDPNSPQIEVTE